MNHAFIVGSVALGLGLPASASTTNSALDLRSVAASVDGEYLSYSEGFGSRRIVNADTRFGLGSTKLSFAVGQGERKSDGQRYNSMRGSATLVRDWSSRLSTRTTASLAKDTPVFANREFIQDISYKLPTGTVATLGGRYARYYRDRDAWSWSLGATQYFRGGFIGYRFSSYDIDRVGHAVGHIVSGKLADPYGSTQLWLGRSTAAVDNDALLTPEKGKFTEVSLRRSLPLKGGIALTAGLKRNWFRTPSAKFEGTGFQLGLTFAPERGLR